MWRKSRKECVNKMKISDKKNVKINQEEILDQKTTMKNLLGLKGQFEQLKESVNLKIKLLKCSRLRNREKKG